MNWRIKGIIQGVLSRIPGGQRLNDYFQETLGGRRNLASHVDAKFEKDWLVTCSLLRELHVPIRDARLMEIGTGWLPVFPLCFSLAGTSTCTTYDLSRHLRVDSVAALLEQIQRHVPAIAAAAGETPDRVLQRLAVLADSASPEEMLSRAGIRYRAPADAARTGMPDASIDIAFSNSVLEHVTVADLDRLFREMHRVVRPGGIILHGVNCGDHYAYFDRSISQLHYLKFSAASWKKWNNDLQYQNRLRPADFLEASARAGFRLLLRRSRPRFDLLDALPEREIAPEFLRYSRDDLCTTSLDFAAVRE